MLNEAMRWASAIQGAIDSKVPIETPTQQLIRDIKVQKDSLYSFCHSGDQIANILLITWYY